MKHLFFRSIVTVVALALLLGLFIGHGAAAPMALATITVDTTDDELNNDGDCSLREAIQAANTDSAVDACQSGSGADTIILPAGTYTLTIAGAAENANQTGDLDILADLTLTGSGADTTILDANALDRAIHVQPGVTANVSGLTITGGQVAGYGGGIVNQGTLNLSNSYVTQNSLSNGDGGGVANFAGVLTVTDCEITDNTVNVYGGGGISNLNGQVTITRTLIDGNTAPDTASGSGGGIKNLALSADAVMSVTDSTISNNQVGNMGGGIANITAGYVATLTVERTVISNNSAPGGNDYPKGLGGGVANSVSTGLSANGGAGVVTIRNSDISNNQATNGGGIGVSPATAVVYVAMQTTVEGSTIRGNTAGGNGVQTGNGGGILSMDGTLTLRNSTLSGNQANGTAGALAMSGLGGGLLAGSMALPGTANVVATTISENTAVLAGGGIVNTNLGAASSTVLFKTSLVSANGAMSCYNQGGTFTSLGYNLESQNSCGFNQASDKINTAPQLGPLANNGGDTWTYALLEGSPAIDAGSCTDHLDAPILTDQRGLPRPQNTACDIGAFEAGYLIYLPLVVK